MLGVEQYGDWPPHEITLPAEWGLLLFSDGIVEARVGTGPRDRLGVDGLRAGLTELWRHRTITSDDLQALVDGVQAGRVDALADDVTLLLLSHDGGAHARGHVI
jgi:serine phosphatase RsbU (regulator of sigma subunit)